MRRKLVEFLDLH
jgi:hypothetical protein